MIFKGFIEKINGEIFSFLTGMAFPHPFVRRNYIYAKPNLSQKYILKLDIPCAFEKTTIKIYN